MRLAHIEQRPYELILVALGLRRSSRIGITERQLCYALRQHVLLAGELDGLRYLPLYSQQSIKHNVRRNCEGSDDQ